MITPQTDSDALGEAMRAYQSGDPAAFDRLYGGLAPIVRRYLRSAARDEGRLEDLVQETFLQIHRARRTYNPQRPVVPWALAIAHHVFLMDCRVRKRKYAPAANELDETIAAAGTGPDNSVIARDELRDGLKGLTAGTREAVLLHHVQGWSFREIGQRLGINSTAAKLRASRGMQALRSHLSPGRRHEDDERQ